MRQLRQNPTNVFLLISTSKSFENESSGQILRLCLNFAKFQSLNSANFPPKVKMFLEWMFGIGLRLCLQQDNFAIQQTFRPKLKFLPNYELAKGKIRGIMNHISLKFSKKNQSPVFKISACEIFFCQFQAVRSLELCTRVLLSLGSTRFKIKTALWIKIKS